MAEENLEALKRRQDGISAAVEALTVEDKIAQGVNRALAARTQTVAQATADKVRESGGPIRLNLAQKIGGGIAGSLVVFDAVRGLIGL